ncbi:MAG: transcriptional regulator [Gemmatimonadota bacterium]
MGHDTTASALNQVGTYFRPRDFAQLGGSFHQLRQLVAEGRVESHGHGLYRVADAASTELETIASVAAVVPHGVLCLLTALQFHEIGTQSPVTTWVAIDRKARIPRHLPTRTTIVRFSSALLEPGVMTMTALGVPFRITSVARTVIDCFRYRHKIGLDVAVEALRETIWNRRASIAELDEMAARCRIRTVMAPYLSALIP